MSDDDRLRWDARYRDRGPVGSDAVGPPPVFVSRAAEFPTAGNALDLACGQGGIAVWLADRGLRVWGVDVSPVAVAQARDLAQRCGVAERCCFDAVDLDAGLPPGEPFEVIVCHRFRDPRLDAGLADRLRPGGLLAIAALRDGPYGASESELRAAFAGLAVVDSGQTDGLAWLMARRPGP